MYQHRGELGCNVRCPYDRVLRDPLTEYERDTKSFVYGAASGRRGEPRQSVRDKYRHLVVVGNL
jgi:hypothetical protein